MRNERCHCARGKFRRRPKAQHGASKRHAFLVAAGIFLSRIAGLVRQRIFAHYFGNSDAADAFNAAFRIPNFLQNMFGEGVLSASFIPVYAGLLAGARTTKRPGEPPAQLQRYWRSPPRFSC
jgi:hypothetical protein